MVFQLLFCIKFIAGYVRGFSHGNSQTLHEVIELFSYGHTELFIVLAIGVQNKKGGWKISKYIIYDGNTCLLVIADLKDVQEVPCMVVYTEQGNLLYFFLSLKYLTFCIRNFSFARRPVCYQQTKEQHA
jgi:hypothetical protein